VPTSVSLFYPPHKRVEAPQPPPPPIVRAQYLIDVSNYQGALTDRWFQEWGEKGFSGIVVQAVTGMDGNSFTGRQLHQANEHGWEINGYIWCTGEEPVTRRRLQLFEGIPIVDLWLDVEDLHLTREDVDIDFRVCDEYMEKQCGMYTGKWVFDRLGWTHRTWWSDRELWASVYDRVPDVDVGFVPFGGWDKCLMKQYTDVPLDQNVRRI
jgi:Glycosyl hydrolases family 25